MRHKQADIYVWALNAGAGKPELVVTRTPALTTPKHPNDVPVEELAKKRPRRGLLTRIVSTSARERMLVPICYTLARSLKEMWYVMTVGLSCMSCCSSGLRTVRVWSQMLDLRWLGA